MCNILFCSAGRRVKLLMDFKETLRNDGKIVVADNSIYAPTRYIADVSYTVPKITDEAYINAILNICKKEKINVVLTLIDPEIEILAKNKTEFEKIGVLVLVPSLETAQLCFDKFEMYKYLIKNKIKTTLTFGTFDEFKIAYDDNKINFPVFVKPRTGSGSVGAKKIDNIEQLSKVMEEDKSLIVQEFMQAVDLDADVYVDIISKRPVSMFTKKKIETKIGGASKTISFRDEKLFSIIKNIVKLFEFVGTIDGKR